MEKVGGNADKLVNLMLEKGADVEGRRRWRMETCFCFCFSSRSARTTAKGLTNQWPSSVVATTCVFILAHGGVDLCGYPEDRYGIGHGIWHGMDKYNTVSTKRFKQDIKKE